MKRGIIAVMIALAACLIINGQVDYKSKGLSYVANGNYVDAQAQFEAARAVLQSKKVNQNAPEFIDIEKKISYAKQCQTFSEQATQSLNKLTDSAIQNAFTQCSTESDADQVRESLFATLEKARNALNNIKSKFSTDRVAKANLDKCAEIQNKINDFRNNFSEVQAWRKAIDANSMLAYEDFLDKYPKGNYSGLAREKIVEFKELLAWNEVRNSGNYESFVQYLKSYPNGAHAEDARQYVNHMGDEMCWSASDEKGTTESYKDYISRYPSGKYITYAKDRLAKCQERDYWNEKSAKNTIAAYKDYIKRYPKGAYVAAARVGIDKITEADAWAKAIKANTIEGYQEYLNTSKKKAFKKEAEDKIASIRHEQDVRADEEYWARIKNATTSAEFGSYLYRKVFKGHETEARFMYNRLRAREYPMDIAHANAIISAFSDALKYGSLDAADKALLSEAQELSSYASFKNSRSLETAMLYLNMFPMGTHAAEVFDAVAIMKADQMDMNVTESEYQEAMSFAKSKDARAYVQKMYSQNQAEYKKYTRSLKREPSHALLALDGIYYNMNENTALDIAPVLSFGGRSNRVNLELGYYLRSGYAVARPRVNLVKKHSLGNSTPSFYSDTKSDGVYSPYVTIPSTSDKQYSKFTLFVAPEFVYFVQPLTNDLSAVYDGNIRPEPTYVHSDFGEESLLEYYPRMDYGARAGVGLGIFDFFAGYRMVSQTFYFGLTLNLSKR